MKEKLLNNIGIKILSLILAAMFWIVIVNIEDPNTEKKFTIPVEVLSGDVINSQDKVYEIVEGDKVEVIVEGRTSLLRSLRASDFKATADLADLTPPWDGVKIWVECPKYDRQNLPAGNFSYKLGKVSVLKVTLEDKITNQYPIQITTNGTVEDGYTLGSKKAKPNMIKISGAKSQIEKIAEVRVNVDISGASENINQKVVPIAYDGKGKVIDSKKLEFELSEVTVSITLLKTSIIPVIITTAGEPSAGYTVIQVDYEPKQVEVAGTEEALKNITSIKMELDVTGKMANWETEIKLADQPLPEGIRLSDDNATVFVKVVIEKLERKDFTLSTGSIDVRNISGDLQIKYKPLTNTNMVVSFRGEKDLIDSLTMSDIKAYVDAGGMAQGIYTEEVRFEVPEGVTVVQAPVLTFELAEAEPQGSIPPVAEPTPSTSPTPEPTPTVQPEEEIPEPSDTDIPDNTGDERNDDME